MYEIKLSNPLHHSPSSPPLPHHQKQHITTTSHHHHHHQPYSSPTHSYQQSNPLHQAYSPGYYTDNNNSNNNLHSPPSPPYQQQNHHYHPHNHSKHHHHHQTENINTYLTMKHNNDYLCTGIYFLLNIIGIDTHVLDLVHNNHFKDHFFLFYQSSFLLPPPLSLSRLF